MEITWDTGPEDEVRRHTITGDLDFDGLVATLNDVYSDPAFRPDQDSLWDLRKARLSTVSTDEVRRVVDFVVRNWGTEGSPRSALVVSTDSDYGMARMYEMLMAVALGPSVGVFKEIGEAEAWLLGGSE